ncbi:acyl-CoA dehydrogenase family protein [Acidianus manzaensis]|uniref:DNA alkylation response protein n=1 Tax=Acidianus manzaensis TaxID=282676 RepID=A0A1W6JZ06_9CREN|nr:acyl-CoA dehydrogenase family protein [Acidianus manzaensis]ARM75513.1 DNA alkylation response protein [Acidianus manzaensis]
MPLKSIEDISFAYGLNHYSVDKPLKDLLKTYTNLKNDFTELGRFVGSEVYESAYRVDLESRPRLVNWSANGERVDYVWIDPFEKFILNELIIKYGVNRYPFNNGTWHDHYTGIYLIGDPGVACILTITIQTAYALYKYGEGEIKERYKNLIGVGNRVEFGATWFTEPQGGSDLGVNSTLTIKVSEGKYLLSGYKYFASGAGIADVSLVSAKTEKGKEGAKGLSLYLVPRYDSSGKLNYFIRRLKQKSGTNSVPTGEVELANSEAYLIGKESEGIYYIMEDLTVSRLSNAMGALGIARKAYLEALGFARNRSAFGKKVIEYPLMIRDLLEMEVSIEGGMALAYKAINEFQKSINSRPPYSKEYHYARFLTHVAKNLTAEISSKVTQIAMEIFGGIGFLDEFPIQRWHREALITPIWEGTSNIQALDMLESMIKKKAHEVYLEDLSYLVEESYDKNFTRKLFNNAIELMKWFSGLSIRDAEFYSKDFLRQQGNLLSSILLNNLAFQSGDELYDLVSKQYYRLYVEKKELELTDKYNEIISIHGGI